MSETWIQNLANKALRICRLNKLAAGNHRQDMTGPVLENLHNQGYTQVMWNSNGSHHAPCRDLNRQVWDLEDFLRTTEYDAPLFSRSHPGDTNCTLVVSGDGVPNVEVDSYGETDEAMGTSRPVREEPKPRVKTLAPKPQPKVIEKPVAPQKKIVYIPKEVHKQIKDPFEKQDLSPEEYEDWLKGLEQENVVEEETPPTQPQLTDEDKEDWLRDLERETSKAKVKPWIYGIFKG